MNPLQRRSRLLPEKLWLSFPSRRLDQGRALAREGTPRSMSPNEWLPPRSWEERGDAQSWRRSYRKRKSRLASTISLRLQPEQLRIKPAVQEQLIVRPLLCNGSLPQDNDAIGHAHGRAAMRSEERR